MSNSVMRKVATVEDSGERIRELELYRRCQRREVPAPPHRRGYRKAAMKAATRGATEPRKWSNSPRGDGKVNGHR